MSTRKVTVTLTVDVYLERGETVDTEHFLGGAPILLTNEREADGYVQAVTVA
jgi:hypothetical protein